jgi:trehalose 6-phosphate synthase/phosphatase
MFSGIAALSASHEQLIVGWTGSIQSPTHDQTIPSHLITDSDKAALSDALRSYQPEEAKGPGDLKAISYIPVWLDDEVAHGHYEGYCKQSGSPSLIPKP